VLYKIRKVRKEDLPALKEVLDSTDLFPSEMLDDMISDYLSSPKSKDIWFTSLIDNIPISVGYCAPEKMTDGTYNLLAIAVRKDLQGKGIGSQMMTYIEDKLRDSNHRILIVETSGDIEYELTREFYKKCNYTLEAVVRSFYSDGEDKIVFWKKL